jgi:superfamily II DNA/RNA helicase
VFGYKYMSEVQQAAIPIALTGRCGARRGAPAHGSGGNPYSSRCRRMGCDRARADRRMRHPRRDLLAKAKTGTGKTLGFLIPVAERLARQPAVRAGGGGWEKRFKAFPSPASMLQQHGMCLLAALHTAHLTLLFFPRPQVAPGGPIRCLVLAPSRELAEQIRGEAEKLLSTHGAQLGVQVGARRGHEPGAGTAGRPHAAACAPWPPGA